VAGKKGSGIVVADAKGGAQTRPELFEGFDPILNVVHPGSNVGDIIFGGGRLGQFFDLL